MPNAPRQVEFHAIDTFQNEGTCTVDVTVKVRGPPVPAQALGQLQAFLAAFPEECMGQLASAGAT